jgi:hypothetical protein
METTYENKQAKFELQICKKLNHTGFIMQSDQYRSQMILDHLVDEELMLSGTIAFKHKESNRNKDVLLVVTRDSELNNIESISLKMIKEIINQYSSNNIISFGRYFEEPTTKKSKIILATNIPIEIHSSKVEELKKKHNFHIQNIGYSFCKENNLEFTEMY